MQGLHAAAMRLGIPSATYELGAHWDRLRDASVAEQRRLRTELAVQLQRARITHILGYGYNGVLDFGVVSTPSSNAPIPALASLGMTHLLLWTDHPNWFMNGDALDPRMSEVLSHPGLFHFVKSEGAARETGALLRWPNVHPLAMAQDCDAIRPPTDAPDPIHDVVVIQSAPTVPHPAALRRLADADPDPAAIDREIAPSVLAATNAWAAEQGVNLSSIAERLLTEKSRQLGAMLYDLACAALHDHEEELAWLWADARRWYAFTEMLLRAFSWRRAFHPMWLSKRASVGFYGSSAVALGIPQQAGADQWVPLGSQSSVYRRGRVALNVNGAHDEQGCTHKPFEIGASGSACVHSATVGLDRLFTPFEVASFDRPAQALELIRSIGASEWRERGEAARARVVREHTWEARITEMLRVASVSRMTRRSA